MSKSAEFPCSTTRQFDRTIHPIHTDFDVMTVRMQIQKHRRITWKQVEGHLRSVNWHYLFSNPRTSNTKGQRITLSFRIRLFKGAGVVNLSTRRLYAKSC